jgi:hypothetical protein
MNEAMRAQGEIARAIMPTGQPVFLVFRISSLKTLIMSKALSVLGLSEIGSSPTQSHQCVRITQ